MSILFGFVHGIPNWQEPGEDVGECYTLKSHCREDRPSLVWIELDGKPYQNKWMDRLCFPCWRLGADVPLVYIGWKVTDGWRFRSKCPVCGQESLTMYRGWGSPQPEKPSGGQQKSRFSRRRERSDY